MTLFEMAAAIAHCDAAMIAEHLDPTLRDQVLQRFSTGMARLTLDSQPIRAPKRVAFDEPLRPGEKPF